MTGTHYVGWDRREHDEWARLPHWWERLWLVVKWRRELRKW